MIPGTLRWRYEYLAELVHQRHPAMPIPPLPDDANAAATVNRQLVCVLNGRPPTTVKVRKEPFVIPEKRG